MQLFLTVITLSSIATLSNALSANDFFATDKCTRGLRGAQNDLVVKIDTGCIEGTRINGTRVFRGIPYVSPPTGNLRWRPPQAHKPWDSTLKTMDFRSSCFQAVSRGHGNKTHPPEGMWPSIQGLNNMSEDCLFMNVMAPSIGAPLAKPSKGFPVMVYIHAGEFQYGSSDDLESNKPLQLPTDVVLVDFNYRLAAFGYLGGDALRGLSPSGSTGNYGLQDQRFALQWVQKNIAQFGGDPDNVMLFGESSGGTCVAWHLTSALSKGLFHKAVLESPGLGQTHTMDESRTNFAFMLGEMANDAKLTNCKFDTGAWQQFGFNIMEEKYSKYLHRVNVTSVQEAEEMCARNASCMGFDYPTNRQPGHAFEARFSKSYSLPWYGKDSRYTTQLKGMNTAKENFPNIRKCLLTAPASVIAQFALYVPLSDTIIEDQWAPVVDGVETLVSVEQAIQQQNFHTPGVPVMLGSNLDEGSTFMFDTPSLSTNASAAEFSAWSKEFGGDRGGDLLPHLYAPRTLEYPHPVINPKVPDDKNYYLSAVRAAGDRAISCPTLGLAYELTQAGHAVYTYSFRITPNRSVNAAPSSMRALGAFHGAEVPFVFGDPSELVKPAERDVAATMGCYWTNFAWNSNPNDAHGRASPNYQKICAGLPSWEDTARSRGQNMVFNITNDHARIDMVPTDRLTHLRCNFWRNLDNHP